MTKQFLLNNMIDADGDLKWQMIRDFDREHGEGSAKQAVHEQLQFERLAKFSLGAPTVENFLEYGLNLPMAVSQESA